MNNKALFKIISAVTIVGTIIGTIIILPTVQQTSNKLVRNELLLAHREPFTYNIANENSNLILYSNNEKSSDDVSVKAYVNGDMKLMSKPLMNSDVIETVKKGSTLEVLARIAVWYKVDYNGKVGYLYAKNAEFKNPVDK